MPRNDASIPHLPVRRKPRNPGRGTPALVLAAALSACVIVKPRDSARNLVMNQEEFGKYVEQVFRYHNQVMNELIEAEESRDELEPQDARELTTAEEKMIELCHPLNDVVAGQLTGESIGLATEINLASTIPACEEASHRVEDLIP